MTTVAEMDLDVLVVNHGSVVIMNCMSERALRWASDHIPEDAQWMGKGFAVEPRYVDLIVEGMNEADLDVAEAFT